MELKTFKSNNPLSDKEYLYKKLLCNECKKNMEDLDRLSINTLNFSTRLNNALKLNKIRTVGSLLNKSISQIVWGMRYVGEKSGKEIIKKIHEMDRGIKAYIEELH